jgi:fructose-1,6-bisphosphatase/inositol monophosphatase family enzyme
LDILISSEKDKGCWINDKRVSLTSTNSLAESVWGTELNPHLTDEHRQRFINTLSRNTLSTRCLACATAGIWELLLSRTNLYINCKGGKIWDFAAGALSVEEAGGVARHIDGSEIIWNSIEMDILLSANLMIANEALRLTSK